MKHSNISISIILPCYNEEALLEQHLEIITDYLHQHYKGQWEIILVNDGSSDKTGSIADGIAANNSAIKVFHHAINMNLGIALQTGFNNASGDIFVVLDIDLSYSPDHIKLMVETLKESHADIVVASPYMKGGKVIAVPFFRKWMSKLVNRFMRMASQDKYHTYTGMVRAYRKEFIQSINLKTRDYEVNPEIIYKAMILRSIIVEVPATLDWTLQNRLGEKRTSGIHLIRGVFSGMMTGFIFRPYVFFVASGLILMLLSMYQLLWLLYDTLHYIAINLSAEPSVIISFSESLALQFTKNPHSFLIGGITFLASLQFLGLGFLSLQNKRYFEELYHQGLILKKQLFKATPKTN